MANQQDKSAREGELWLGRTALARGMITGRYLTEALLAQSATGMRKPLESVFLERNLLSRDQIRQLRSSLEGTPTSKQPRGVDQANAKRHLGKIVNRVLCDSVLNVSRFVTTYVGRLPRDPEPVALQLIDKGALRHGLWMDFLEAVRGCIGVKVRNLVEVLDVGRTDDAFAVVTRYKKGGITLADLISRVRRLKLSESLRITREITQGVSALHAAGLTHRDIKPENVLLGRAGEVQLMNAGVVFEPEGASRFAAPRTVFGTPHFLAPEALNGSPPDPMTDVYALGVLAYELVTGIKPFEGSNLLSLREQHLENDPVPPHSVMTALPKDVGELLVWMLAKDPKERPPAAKLVTTLERLEKSIKRTGMTQKFQAFDPND